MNLFKKILCKIGLHSFKDEIVFTGEYNRTKEEIPAILRQRCRRCKKIQNELRGKWLIGIEKTWFKH